MSNFDEREHPRDNYGKFTDKGGGESSNGIKKQISWARRNGKELPLNKDGSLNDIALRKMYDERDKSEDNAWKKNKRADDDDHVVEVNMDSDIQKQFDRATPKERQKIAFRYIMDNLRGKYPAEDGRVIAIERVGADKMTHSFDERKIRVLPELKTLIDVGRLRGVIDVNHKLFSQMAYYDVAFKINNELYNARLNVGIRNNGDSTLYDIKPIEEAKK